MNEIKNEKVFLIISNLDITNNTIGTEADSWNLEMINVRLAWNMTMGSENVTVAVIDSGITWNPELPETLRWENEAEVNGTDGIDDDSNGYVDDYYGFDFAEDTYDNDSSTDTSGRTIHRHGTFVTGIIAGQHNNVTIAGVSPNVKIMDLRVLDPDNSFYSFTRIYDAFSYAIEMNASVINFSIYFNGEASSSLKSIFKKANDHGIPIVGITGNNGRTTISHPGTEPTIIATGALDEARKVADFSNTGSETELVAPGDMVPSITQAGGILESWGTSYAAPHVTGTIALMKSLRDDLPTRYIREILAYTATDLESLGRDSKSGYGLINTSQAVSRWLDFDNNSQDFDQDGLNNTLEVALGSSIILSDTDKDGMSDDFEYEYGLNILSNDAHLDPDEDGFSNLIEFQEGTDPTKSESYPTDYTFPVTTTTSITTTTDSSSENKDSNVTSVLYSFIALFIITYHRKRKNH